MSRRDSLLARCVVEACQRVSHGRFQGCPFHSKCGDLPGETCFEEILAWMDGSDPATELGPGELQAVDAFSEDDKADQHFIEIVSAPRPDTPEAEAEVTLQHYSELLQKLAQAVPLPGSPTLAECVDEAIRIIEESKGKR